MPFLTMNLLHLKMAVLKFVEVDPPFVNFWACLPAVMETRIVKVIFHGQNDSWRKEFSRYHFRKEISFLTVKAMQRR